MRGQIKCAIFWHVTCADIDCDKSYGGGVDVDFIDEENGLDDEVNRMALNKLVPYGWMEYDHEWFCPKCSVGKE